MNIADEIKEIWNKNPKAKTVFKENFDKLEAKHGKYLAAAIVGARMLLSSDEYLKMKQGGN